METSTPAGALNLAEVNVEPVREHQSFARRQMRARFRVCIEIALDMIRDQNHHHVGGLGGVADWREPSARRLRPWPRSCFQVQPDHDVHAAVAQIQRVGVALAAVADDGDRLVLQ